MTLRDLLLVLGAVPLLGVVGLRLAAEMGFGAEPPPAEALTTSLGVFGFVFVVYVALTLRSIASATRDILARDVDAGQRASAAKRQAAVSDFAIHLDRSSEVDLREDDEAEPPPEAAPGGATEPTAPGRSERFAEVSDLLTRIPSARPR